MVVLADFQVNGLNPSVVSAASASVQYFPRLLGTSIGVQSVAPSSSSNAGGLAVPGSSRLNAQLFEVVLAGTIVSGAGTPSETATITLSASTAKAGATPSYTVIASSGAFQINHTIEGPNNFYLKVKLLGDSLSGIVGGTQQAVANGVVTQSEAALTSNLSSIDMSAEPPFVLVAGVTFSSASALNVAKLYQFQLGQ
jgi:hypothetical protein